MLTNNILIPFQTIMRSGNGSNTSNLIFNMANTTYTKTLLLSSIIPKKQKERKQFKKHCYRLNQSIPYITVLLSCGTSSLFNNKLEYKYAGENRFRKKGHVRMKMTCPYSKLSKDSARRTENSLACDAEEMIIKNGNFRIRNRRLQR